MGVPSREPRAAGEEDGFLGDVKYVRTGDEEDGFPDSYAVIHGDWKLIWNVEVRDDRPELELFNHRDDPINLNNVASEHPDLVAGLHGEIETWLARAEAERVSDDALAEDLSPQELEQLRALGYVN